MHVIHTFSYCIGTPIQYILLSFHAIYDCAANKVRTVDLYQAIHERSLTYKISLAVAWVGFYALTQVFSYKCPFCHSSN